jgi:hypothetical protein
VNQRSGDGLDTRVLASTPDGWVAGLSPTVGEEGGSPASPDGVGTVIGLVPQELDVGSSPSVSLGRGSTLYSTVCSGWALSCTSSR